MKAIIRRSLPAALTATLVAGAAVTIPAVAATDDTAAEESTEDAAHDGFPGLRHKLGHGLEEGEFAALLAEELGLEAETVEDAIDAVVAGLAEERLAEAVEDGRLTQEQADALAAALADGDREAAQEIVREARLAHLEERLAEKVEAGELTQEQADEILERAENGEFRGRHGRRGPGVGGFGGDVAPDLDAPATDTSST